jgi:hypothetical protein
MKNKIRFLGLDIQAQTISVAIVEPDGEVRILGAITNRAESVRKLVKDSGWPSICGLAPNGPTGYVLY